MSENCKYESNVRNRTPSCSLPGNLALHLCNTRAVFFSLLLMCCFFTLFYFPMSIFRCIIIQFAMIFQSDIHPRFLNQQNVLPSLPELQSRVICTVSQLSFAQLYHRLHSNDAPAARGSQCELRCYLQRHLCQLYCASHVILIEVQFSTLQSYTVILHLCLLICPALTSTSVPEEYLGVLCV